MDAADQVRTRFPYPIARAFAALEDPAASLQLRQEALYFSVYQLMRTVGLTLLGQYLIAPLPESAQTPEAERSRAKLASTIARLRSPYFSDWIALLKSLSKRAELLGLDFMPGFLPAMAAVKTERIDIPRDYGFRDNRQMLRWQDLDLWDAFLALRNHTAHSGQTSDDVCRDDLALYRAALDRLFAHFGFLADYRLVAADADLDDEETELDAVPVRELRGAATPETLYRN